MAVPGPARVRITIPMVCVGALTQIEVVSAQTLLETAADARPAVCRERWVSGQLGIRVFACEPTLATRLACRDLAAALRVLDREPSLARTRAEQALAELGPEPEARSILGRAWLRMGEPEDAYSVLTGGGSDDWPRDSLGLRALALASALLGRNQVAEKAYRKALAHPLEGLEKAQLQLEFAAVLSRQVEGDGSEAIALLERASREAREPGLVLWADGLADLVDAMHGRQSNRRGSRSLAGRAEADPGWRRKILGPEVFSERELRLPRAERIAVVAQALHRLDRYLANEFWQAVVAPMDSPLGRLAVAQRGKLIPSP